MIIVQSAGEDKLKQYLISRFIKIWQIITRVLEKTTIILFVLIVYILF